MTDITFAQSRYINVLANECRTRGIELPEEVQNQIRNLNDLSAKEARELIDNLKLEMGWKE